MWFVWSFLITHLKATSQSWWEQIESWLFFCSLTQKSMNHNYLAKVPTNTINIQIYEFKSNVVFLSLTLINWRDLILQCYRQCIQHSASNGNAVSRFPLPHHWFRLGSHSKWIKCEWVKGLGGEFHLDSPCSWQFKAHRAIGSGLCDLMTRSYNPRWSRCLGLQLFTV